MMKKVLLIGDSIRMGYAQMVKDLLKDEAEVIFPGDNSCFVQYAYWQTNQMFLRNDKIDIVHFNSGYWDMNIEYPMSEAFNSLAEYIAGLTKMIKYIKKQNAKPIFALTLPIYKDGSSIDNTGLNAVIQYNQEWVLSYNNAAKALMSSLNVEVNDLYSSMLLGDKYYKCADMLHLTYEGSMVCAQQIAELIRKYL